MSYCSDAVNVHTSKEKPFSCFGTNAVKTVRKQSFPITLSNKHAFQNSPTHPKKQETCISYPTTHHLGVLLVVSTKKPTTYVSHNETDGLRLVTDLRWLSKNYPKHLKTNIEQTLCTDSHRRQNVNEKMK